MVRLIYVGFTSFGRYVVRQKMPCFFNFNTYNRAYIHGCLQLEVILLFRFGGLIVAGKTYILRAYVRYLTVLLDFITLRFFGCGS